MAAYTTTVTSAWLNWVSGNTTPSAAATRYITTFNGDPQSGGTENISTITGSANRINMTTAVPTTATATVSSNADIVFTTSASAGATVNYIAIYTAITGGTLLASASVTSRTLVTGDGLKIPSGSLTLSIS